MARGAAGLAAAALTAALAAGPRAAWDSPTAVWTLPATVLPLSPARAAFLLDHPDFAARLARRRGLGGYRAEPLGPGRWAVDDGEGTSGELALAASAGGTRVYQGDGVHRGRFLPALRADAVLVLAVVPAEGSDRDVAVSAEAAVRARGRFAGALARLLRPFVARAMAARLDRLLRTARREGDLWNADPAAVAAEAEAFGGLSLPGSTGSAPSPRSARP